MKIKCWKCNKNFAVKVPQNIVFTITDNKGFSRDCPHCGMDNSIVVCIS